MSDSKETKALSIGDRAPEVVTAYIEIVPTDRAVPIGGTGP